jgi:hypothetical protein
MACEADFRQGKTCVLSENEKHLGANRCFGVIQSDAENKAKHFFLSLEGILIYLQLPFESK